ncbi:hypothetical protein NECID01_0559 [Nematocida sp. AWRm77]|nr:hypothetical protein NECID01_0559 [Nematocida sp. AWRm77]
MADSSNAELGVLLEQCYNVRNRSGLKKIKLLKEVARGGYAVFLSKVPEYLRVLREVSFIESAVLKVLLSELVNLDVGVTVALSSMSEKERKWLIEETEREANAHAEDSPVSEYTSSAEKEDTKQKLLILYTGMLSIAQYVQERGTDRRLFNTLLNVFEEKVLPLSDSSLAITPQVFFISISGNAKYAEEFVYFLLRRIHQENVIRKKKLFVYLCSFLVNLKSMSPSIWEVVTKDVLSFAQERIQAKDTFSSVCLDVLIRLSLRWGAMHSAQEIDKAIMSVYSASVKRKVDVHVQAFYKRRHPEYDIVSDAVTSRLFCPFSSNMGWRLDTHLTHA